MYCMGWTYQLFCLKYTDEDKSDEKACWLLFLCLLGIICFPIAIPICLLYCCCVAILGSNWTYSSHQGSVTKWSALDVCIFLCWINSISSYCVSDCSNSGFRFVLCAFHKWSTISHYCLLILHYCCMVYICFFFSCICNTGINNLMYTLEWVCWKLLWLNST